MANITRKRTASIQKSIHEILSLKSEHIYVNQVLEELEALLPSNDYEKGI